MIWLKRLLPLVLIVGGWFAWSQYQEYTAERYYRDAERYALVTAQVWLASAEYRDDPHQFVIYRDSLLEAAGLSVETIDQYIKMYSSRPEAYTPYVRLVKKYIDSLSQPPADSLDRGRKLRTIDTSSNR